MDYSELLLLAEAAQQHAYVPYSQFPVGVALLTKDGKIFTGCNVENASFGLTICAERVAIGKAISEGCREFKAIAITAAKASPCLPCGACRQVLAEFAPDLELVFRQAEKQVWVLTLNDVLPFQFTNASLGGPA
ncbi:MAG TPA: cytidine deaminase [Chroococcales cyanobacterium]|jgi:cytidine deaminase